MKRLKFVLAALVVLLATACKQQGGQNTYTIDGTAEGLADGEQLILADREGMTVDSVEVKGGKFSYTGSSDVVAFCALYSASNPMNSVNFFTEPGTISVVLSGEQGKSVVAGTTANDALQKLVEETNPYFEKINDLEKTLGNDTEDADDEWALVERYNQIYSELANKFKEAAEANIDNELGYMLVTSYIDPREDASLLRQLIEKMPQAFRERELITQLTAFLKASEVTEPGNKIEDFSLDTPAGESVSVLSEVQKNQITIVDFWASWCGPCRKEMPLMREIYANYHDKGLGIVGISLDEKAEDWQKAIDELQLTWPQLSDLQGWESPVAQKFHITAIPFTLILDNDGTIIQKGLRGAELEKFVSSALN